MCFGRGWDSDPDDPCIYCKGSGLMKDKVVKGQVKESKEKNSVKTPKKEG